MSARRRSAGQSGQTLIILVTALLLGGSAAVGASIGVGVFVTGRPLTDVKQAIRRVVPDEGRREAAEAVIDSWEADVERLRERNTECRQRLVPKLEQYDAAPEELRAVFGEIQAANRDLQECVLDRRFQLRQHLVAEEWAQVFAR